MAEVLSACISCLDSKNILNIFDTHECLGMEEIYADMLKLCFDVTMLEEAGLNGMCLKCVHKLRDCFNFKQSILKNIEELEKKLRVGIEYFNDENPNEHSQELTTLSSTVKMEQEFETDSEDTFYLIVKNDDKTVDGNQKASEKTDKGNNKFNRGSSSNLNENGKSVEEKKLKAKKKQKATKTLPFKISPGQTQCSICNEVFQNSKTLLEHMNTHYPNYVCEECGKKFACKLRIARHMKTHKEGPFRCNICAQEFTKINTRNAHIWRVHQAKEPYVCSHCGQRFTTFNRRLSHLQQQHGLTPDYPCPYCDNKYFYSGSRSKHVRSTHMRVRNHKCEHCKMAFFKRRALLSHMASVHDIGEKQHKCTICDKSFYRSTTLKFHIKRHMDKKFICNICKAQFTYQPVWKAHMKIHELENAEQSVIVEDAMFEGSNDTVYFEVI